MNEKRVWDALLAAIGNPFGAAGLMGNLYAESALNPRNLQQAYEAVLRMTDDSYTAAVDKGRYTNFIHDGAGYGLAQWTYWSRKEKLLAFARTRGVSIGDLDMQLDFLIDEVKQYTAVWSALISASSVRAASDAVLLQYERPRDQSDAVQIKRAGFGQRYYDTYAKGVDDMATVKIGSARIDENGRATGGKAGDQTGKEVSTQAWYKHSKGWRVFRAKDSVVAEKIAWDMQAACDNPHIGYDQGQRNTLYDVSKPLGFNCAKVTTNCETDCSALVRVCCAYAGIMLPNFRTTNEPQVLLDSGAFVELTGSRYTDSPDYLKRGDILDTRTQGHTVVVLSNGSRAGAVAAPVTPTEPAPDGLRRGDKGDDVRAMQRALLIWRTDCLPRWGADGDFGQETEDALRAYQASAGLPVTGVYDDATHKALTSIGRMQYVRITGGSVNVRSAPGTGYKVLGVVHQDYRLPYQGETHMVSSTPWYCVAYDNQMGWVSGKFAEVIEG